MLSIRTARWGPALLALVIAWVIGSIGTPAYAGFVRGRVYVSVAAAEGLSPPYPQRILEYDPVVTTWRDFALMPASMGRPIGLAFTPDGTHLRASMYGPASVIEIDSDGKISTVLDDAEGFVGNGTIGANNIAYGPGGDFYAQATTGLYRFPAGGGSGTLFMPGSFQIAMTFGADGTFYRTGGDFKTIYRLDAEGKQSLVDSWPSAPPGVYSLTIGPSHTLYALIGSSIYAYPSGQGPRQLLATIANAGVTPSSGAIALNPEGSVLYLAVGRRLYSIDTQTGQYDVSPLAPTPEAGVRIGAGIAVYVPEPATLFAFIAFLPFLQRRFERTAAEEKTSSAPSGRCFA